MNWVAFAMGLVISLLSWAILGPRWTFVRGTLLTLLLIAYSVLLETIMKGA